MPSLQRLVSGEHAVEMQPTVAVKPRARSGLPANMRSSTERFIDAPSSPLIPIVRSHGPKDT
jgi:hypothetical protein